MLHDDLIVDITHPYSLATDLLRQKLISFDIADAMLSEHLIKTEKIVLLVNAVRKSTADNPSAFNAFIRSLEVISCHRNVAGKLRQIQGRLLNRNRACCCNFCIGEYIIVESTICSKYAYTI